jgi:HEAT repeat protein
MRSHEGWAMRVLAAQALGRLGASGKGDIASKDAARHLGEAARKESFALVREAALVALASFDKPSAATTAAQMEKSDPEPRVRETAAKIRAGK